MMKKRSSRENLLAEHAQALVAGDEGRRIRARLLARGYPEVLALMDVAERLQKSYRSLRAPEHFRAQLRDELIANVKHRQIVHFEHRTLRSTRTYWLLGAIASLLSVAAGGVGYYLHHRSQAAS